MFSASKPSCLVFAVICTITVTLSYGQDLEQLGVKQGVKVNGSININSVSYYASHIEQRRDPFNWFVSGNLNFNLFGYSAPLSFSLSNTNRSFSQPFNRLSFAPQYKWVKVYVGYNSMTFSNYTLAGHLFLGGGVELTPGKWKVSAMYGRFLKAVPFNLEDTLQYTHASYKRMGGGIKVAYDDNGNSIAVSIFTAKDFVNSIPFLLPGSQLTPQQNVAVSISGRKKFLKRFFIDAEYAVSALNKDISANSNSEDTIVFKPTNNIVRGLLPENATSRYFDAMNAGIGYQGSWYSIQLKYQRIAPEYQTLGAYYFNNDLRNITIAPTVRLLKNTLNLSANLGIQQNNLDDDKASTTKRKVGSININYAPNEKWNLGGNYSNFTSFTNIKPQPDPFLQNRPLDTLNYYQISQTMNGVVMRNLGDKDKPQSIMVNLSYQKATDKAGYENANQQSDFLNFNASYSYALVPSNTTLAIGGNMYKNNAAGVKNTYWGPTLTCMKSFLEKTWRFSWASSYNETTGGNIQSSPILNNRLGLTINPKSKNDAGAKSKHNFTVGMNVLNKLKITEQQPAFSEYTATCNYTYSF